METDHDRFLRNSAEVIAKRQQLKADSADAVCQLRLARRSCELARGASRQNRLDGDAARCALDVADMADEPVADAFTGSPQSRRLGAA